MPGMKRVVIDCRFASGATGLGRYTRELALALLERNDPWSYVLLIQRGATWIMPESNAELIPMSAPHYSLSEQLMLPHVLRQARADLLFSPHFNVPVFCPVPMVVTIHDLILHRFPNSAPFYKRLAYRWLMKSAVKRAKNIIAVSHFTASELRSVYGDTASDKMTVIPEAVSPLVEKLTPDEAGVVLARYGISNPFFLYVGNAKEHKNVPMLLKAYEALGPGAPQLILVSGGLESEKLKLPLGAKRLSMVTDEELPALYSTARAFVTASLYEGFGLPIVEAAFCGCPVIAVEGSAVSEVAPEGSVLVPPTVEALTQALKNPPTLISPPPVCSWQAVAEQTAATLGAALGVR